MEPGPRRQPRRATTTCLYQRQGCHSFFQIFFQVFQISSRFLKVHIFGSIFSLKLISIKETVLNRIKALKRYFKVTLNVFFHKKIFDDDIKRISV